MVGEKNKKARLKRGLPHLLENIYCICVKWQSYFVYILIFFIDINIGVFNSAIVLIEHQLETKLFYGR